MGTNSQEKCKLLELLRGDNFILKSMYLHAMSWCSSLVGSDQTDHHWFPTHIYESWVTLLSGHRLNLVCTNYCIPLYISCHFGDALIKQSNHDSLAIVKVAQMLKRVPAYNTPTSRNHRSYST